MAKGRTGKFFGFVFLFVSLLVCVTIALSYLNAVPPVLQKYTDSLGLWCGFFSENSPYSAFSLAPLALFLIWEAVVCLKSKCRGANTLKAILIPVLFLVLRTLTASFTALAVPSAVASIPFSDNLEILCAVAVVLFALIVIIGSAAKARAKKKAAAEALSEQDSESVSGKPKKTNKKKASAEKKDETPSVKRGHVADGFTIETKIPEIKTFDLLPVDTTVYETEATKVHSVKLESSVNIGVFEALKNEPKKEENTPEPEPEPEAARPLMSWANYRPSTLSSKLAADRRAERVFDEMQRKAQEEEDAKRWRQDELFAEKSAEPQAETYPVSAEPSYEEPEEMPAQYGGVSADFETAEEQEEVYETPAPAPAPVEEKKEPQNAAQKPQYKVAKGFCPVPGDDTCDEDMISGVGGIAHVFDPSQPVNVKNPYYRFPPDDFLAVYPKGPSADNDPDTLERAQVIIDTLAQFRVEVSLSGIVRGPSVTMFEYSLAPGIKISALNPLTQNVAMSLAVDQVRLLAPIPGKQAVGFEVPNRKRDSVGMKEMLDTVRQSTKMAVPVALGKNITGDNIVMDIAKAPHMLIAGTTGSGKSVCVNTMICSVLYTKRPEEVRFIMVDPKMVELKVYNGIPHLLTPVITDAKKAVKALKFCIEEMERRLNVISSVNVRNIGAYNEKVEKEHLYREKMPYIIVIMDEFADLMTVAGKEIETMLARLTAMSRAVGIHLVFATQRPSAEVVTGLIKSNLPTKIAFKVSNSLNSKIILDAGGAESLLGRGDMLFQRSDSPDPERIQGAFLSDEEVDDIASFVKTQGEPKYIDESCFEDPEPEDDMEDEDGEYGDGDSDSDIYQAALKIVCERQMASASYLQRRLSIGYNRAARLIERMEDDGYVGPARGSKPREIIKFPD